jgi:peptidoglycan glycosyltransferase
VRARTGEQTASSAAPWASRDRPLAGRLIALATAVSIAFGGLALGAGYWQVIRADELTRSPDDAANLALARTMLRGRILDRDGRVLATSRRTEDGTLHRVYVDPAVSHPVGYASPRYGAGGLERAYARELTGASGPDPASRALAKFLPPADRRLDLRTSLSLSLQRLAVRLLGDDRGAVVMLDPRSGEVLVMAATPTFDAGAIAHPATAEAAFAALRADPSAPLLNRATMGLYVPGSVFKIVTAIAALGSESVQPSTTFAQQPAAEEEGLLVSGFLIRGGDRPDTGGRPLDLVEATEISSNIWYALAGLETGGGNLDAFARRLGFGAPLPFDLPTARSQLTNGGGPLAGGFSDDVELANAAYGQGEVLVTPLQMALVAATVANDGELMRPRLVTALIDRQGRETPVGPTSLGRVIDAAHNAALVEAMTRAVEGELGRLFTTGARVPGILTAGKSGTAELDGGQRPHSWFIGFAPADAPVVAIAVVVEGGGRGGERASPLAGQMLRAYFGR